MFEAVLALVSTTALLLGSPGPAPLALAATSATYGFRNGIPFLLGILAGLSIAIFAAATGLATLFSLYPKAQLVCQYVGAAYILFIAYRIASAPAITSNAEMSAPKFRDGFILNLFNPKAYAAFLAIFSQFILPISHPQIKYVATAITCLIVATIVDIIWLAMGGLLKPVFKSPLHSRVIRIVFAVLMIYFVYLALLN